MSLKLSGIVPPLITPLKARDTLDEAGLERLIEHEVAGGVSGLFILGTTGEAPSLSYRLRKQFIDQVCRLVGGRIPVLVGITDTAFVESVALAKHASAAGAAAVVLSTPYYFPAGQTELKAYVDNMVAELPLPLVLYNMPSLTKVWFEVDTLQALQEHPSIIGVKDSSGDLAYFKRVVELKKHRPDWSVFIGPEAMLPEAMELGGDGGVAGGANIVPHWFVECYEACRRQDEMQLALIREKIYRLQEIYEIGKYASRFIKATKCGASLLGLCEDHMADPFHKFLPPERARVEAILVDLGVL
ncbi:MAG: dihydrodipicolinate synthase family protein [Planctomycetales bacterium]|nr:dihydrodipicolinate synthase family protein [Planctomycetales bacterium]